MGFSLINKNKLPPGMMQRTFECKRGDLFIRGTEYRPQGDHLPIAIVCHGFMAWQDSVKHYALALAEMGYAAYCFDFSGGSVMRNKSDGSSRNMSVLTEVMDLEAVIAYVKTLPFVNPQEIFLMGCSQGGFVSALAAAKNRFPIRKLCLFYPALCIPDDARAGKMMALKFDPSNIPEKMNCGFMKLGRCYVEDVIGMDPFEEIKSYDGDVLIVQGAADKIVHPDYAKKAESAYESAKTGRVSLLIIEDGAHGFSKKHDVIAISALQKFAE